MRISCHTALLLCLCLWIPVVQSEHISDDDEETSGYDFSGSGSGDDVIVEFSNTASTNTTKTAWVTDVPVSITERTVTHLFSDVIPLAGGATATPTTQFPLLHTTKVPERQPSPTSVKLHFQVKDELDVKTTTIRHADKEETITLPAENPPLLPETTEQTKITSRVEKTEEKSTVSVLLVEEEDGTTAPVEIVDHAVDEETTSLPLTTTSANEPADTDTSGDNVETTTVLATVENSFTEENIIPEVNHELEKPLTEENDFHFEIDNEISKTRALQPQSGSARGSSSENDNLLERKEVLAGVIAGGVVGLAFAIMLVSLMVYRMKKKDEGSYSLDEHKHPNVGYQKPQRQEEFLA